MHKNYEGLSKRSLKEVMNMTNVKFTDPSRPRAEQGYTIIELLIAALITGIITAAAFGFYISMNNQAESQIDVSEISNSCRASLFDIRKTLHMAGNRLGAHPAFELTSDSLSVYFSESKPVDTITYFLKEFTNAQYAAVQGLPKGQKLYKLMKKRDNLPESVFADFITEINFIPINPTTIAVTISAQASRKDDTFSSNGGFRTFSLGERVNLRYLQLI